MINSTISDNRSETDAFSHLIWHGDVISSTIAGELGAHLYDTRLIGGGVRLANSVIVNTALDPGPACSRVESGGGNIESPGNSCGLSDPTDLVNVSAEDLNLGPLADNGGPTMTHALLPGSVAIDRIPESKCVDADGEPLTADQRGFPRGAMCDVGAFEVQP